MWLLIEPGFITCVDLLFLVYLQRKVVFENVLFFIKTKFVFFLTSVYI